MNLVSWDDHGVASLVQARTVSATLPVVLCAPHGGNAVDGDQSETLLERPVVTQPARDPAGEGRGQKSKSTISLVTDIGTAQLLEEIDRRLTRKVACGNRRDSACGFAKVADAPAAVVARFHRKYVDANRPLGDKNAIAVHPSCARAREVHERYHAAIETAVSSLGSRCHHTKSSFPDSSKRGEAVEENGRGRRENKVERLLLLDVHGQSKYTDKVIIGTWYHDLLFPQLIEPPLQTNIVPIQNIYVFSNGKTADLQGLNAPGKGFLWHLRSRLNGDQGDANGAGIENEGDLRTLYSERGQQRLEGVTGRITETGRAEEIAREQTGRSKEEYQTVAIKQAQKIMRDDALVVLPYPGDREVVGYTGGYTVKRHGLLARFGHRPGGKMDEGAGAAAKAREGSIHPAVHVDAVQLEFGSDFRRTPEARATTAEAVATAIYYHLQRD